MFHSHKFGTVLILIYVVERLSFRTLHKYGFQTKGLLGFQLVLGAIHEHEHRLALSLSAGRVVTFELTRSTKLRLLNVRSPPTFLT